MPNINIEIDPILHQEFKRHIGRETIKEAIPRLMRQEVGWLADNDEVKLAELRKDKEKLSNEISFYENKISNKTKAKLSYLKLHFNPKKFQVKQVWMENNSEIVHDYAEAGITFNDLWVNWEVLHE